jgi:hypothetical protein
VPLLRWAWVEMASSASGCAGWTARDRFGAGGQARSVFVVSAWSRGSGGVMCGERSKDRELRLLGELCVALAGLGVAGLQLRDAVPGMTVSMGRDAGGGVSAYVVINHGMRFSWWSVEHSHPVSDVEGAARSIVEFLRQDDASSDGGGSGS